VSWPATADHSKPVSTLTSLAVAARAKEQGQRAWLGRNTNTLADLFTAPDSVSQIRALLARQSEAPGGQAFVRQLFQNGM
jgi:hypothetical protein